MLVCELIERLKKCDPLDDVCIILCDKRNLVIDNFSNNTITRVYDVDYDTKVNIHVKCDLCMVGGDAMAFLSNKEEDIYTAEDGKLIKFPKEFDDLCHYIHINGSGQIVIQSVVKGWDDVTKHIEDYIFTDQEDGKDKIDWHYFKKEVNK